MPLHFVVVFELWKLEGSSYFNVKLYETGKKQQTSITGEAGRWRIYLRANSTTMYCNLCQVSVKIPQSRDVIIMNELCWGSMDNLPRTSGVYYVHTYPGNTRSRSHICIWRACLHFWPSGVPSILQCHIYTAGPEPVCWAPWGPRWPIRPDEASFRLDLAENNLSQCCNLSCLVALSVFLLSETQKVIEEVTLRKLVLLSCLSVLCCLSIMDFWVTALLYIHVITKQ